MNFAPTPRLFLNPDDAENPDGETWIYAGGGVTADPAILEPDIVALRVEAGGALGEGADGRWDVGTMQSFRAGYAAMLFNDQLFAFGGTNAMPVSEGSSVEICLDAGCSPGATTGTSA